MNKQRLAILIVAGLGALATFMPWVKAPIVGTINGTKGDGWITLVLFAVPLVISLLNDKTKALKGGPLYGAIIPSLVAGAIGVWKIIEFNSKMSDIGDNPFAKALGATVSIEFGLYLVVLAGIALPIVAFLIKDKEVVSE
jgi:ABC-type phosphate transport system permease subunit